MSFATCAKTLALFLRSQRAKLSQRSAQKPLSKNRARSSKSGNLHRVTGLGDTVFVSPLSPNDNLTGNWLLGVGPTFIFATAANSRLGQNKGQMGPADVVVISARNSSSGCFRSGGGRRAERDQTPLASSIFNVQLRISFEMGGAWGRRQTYW